MANLTLNRFFPMDLNMFFPGFVEDREISFKLTKTTATWQLDDVRTLTVTGTNLDAADGEISTVVMTKGRSGDTTEQVRLTGLHVDFSTFREGIDNSDWDKIGSALKGIDLNVTATGRNIFQGLGGDDQIVHKGPFSEILFDGGKDTVKLGNGQDFAVAASVNYIPSYKAIRWDIDAGGGEDEVLLWMNADELFKGAKIINIATEGMNITLDKVSTFLTGTAIFRNFENMTGTPFNDRLIGNASKNEFVGGDGNDYLDGLGGADRLNGDGGDDTLILRDPGDHPFGGDGTDTVVSLISIDRQLSSIERVELAGSQDLDAHVTFRDLNSGPGTIIGNGGDNQLSGYGLVKDDEVGWYGANLNGGDGDDILNGGQGINTLVGGRGKDELYGGSSADTFLLNSISGSTAAVANRDTIHDFSQPEHDRIGLSRMDANSKAAGDQDFTFIGSQAFHHVAAELRYSISGNRTLIFGDVNGDGKADFALEVDGKVDFQEGDFIL